MQEVISSFGSDDDSIKIKFVATHIGTLHGVSDGTIVRTGYNSFAIVKGGVLVDVGSEDIPDTFLMAFTHIQTNNELLKYPYSVKLKESNNEFKKA